MERKEWDREANVCYGFNNTHWALVYLLRLCVLVARSYSTVYDPTYCKPPGSSVHTIFQGRILQWVAIFYSRGSSQPRDSLPLRHLGRLYYP